MKYRKNFLSGAPECGPAVQIVCDYRLFSVLHRMPLDQVDAALIYSMCAEQEAESIHLEFKEWTQRSEKLDIMQEVSAFANSAGGDIIIGIKDRRDKGRAIGRSERITGVENADRVHASLLDSIRDLIDPRIVGITSRVIKTADGDVIVIRVPRSFSGPHIVRDGGRFSCHMRNSFQKQPLYATQLRAAFIKSDVAAIRIREEFKTIRKDTTDRWAQEEGAYVIVQVQPLVKFVGEYKPNLRVIFDRPDIFSTQTGFRFAFFGHGRYTYCLEGVRGTGSSAKNVCFFRDGGIVCATEGCNYRKNDKSINF